MNIKRILILLLPLLSFLFPLQLVNAATIANTFQITTDGSQQTSPFIYNKKVIYSSNSDIWGYNLETGINYPVLEKDSFQFTTDLFRHLVIYEDTPVGEIRPDVRMYNLHTSEDTLIAGNSAVAETSGVTNGKHVIYVIGGACGTLHAYNIHDKISEQIASAACHPVRVSGDNVVWANGAPGGTNIYGYDLKNNVSFDVTTEDHFQESPNIFNNYVVWLHYTTGARGDYQAIRLKDLKTGETRTIYETNSNALQLPAISNKYVVWSESSARHVNGVQAANIKTGEVFEVQEQGPHQNSTTSPDISKNVAAWKAWRTGNGDIYGSEFTK